MGRGKPETDGPRNLVWMKDLTIDMNDPTADDRYQRARDRCTIRLGLSYVTPGDLICTMRFTNHLLRIPSRPEKMACKHTFFLGIWTKLVGHVLRDEKNIAWSAMWYEDSGYYTRSDIQRSDERSSERHNASIGDTTGFFDADRDNLGALSKSRYDAVFHSSGWEPNDQAGDNEALYPDPWIASNRQPFNQIDTVGAFHPLKLQKTDQGIQQYDNSPAHSRGTLGRMVDGKNPWAPHLRPLGSDGTMSQVTAPMASCMYLANQDPTSAHLPIPVASPATFPGPSSHRCEPLQPTNRLFNAGATIICLSCMWKWRKVS